MAAFFLYLFLLFFFVLLVLLVLGFRVLGALFGGFSNLRHLAARLMGWGDADESRRESAKTSVWDEPSSSTSSTHDASSRPSSSSDGKLFGDNEGTYVDFEEV